MSTENHKPTATIVELPPGLIAAFTFGNFVIGTGIVALAGMLNPLALGNGVSLSVAGQLFAVGGVVMALGAPLAAAFTSRIDRRKLLVVSMLIYALGNLACAIAPSFFSLVLARAFAVIAPAVFTPQAAATLGTLLPPEKRGVAVTKVFLGWSLASVIGMPLGNVIAETIGWRYTFALLTAMSLASAFWLARVMKPGWTVPPVSLESWRQTARHPQIRLVLLVTMLSTAGQFITWSYINPLLNFWLANSIAWVSLMMVFFGLFGFAGSTWMTLRVPKLGPDRAVQRMLYCMLVGVMLWCGLPWVAQLIGHPIPSSASTLTSLSGAVLLVLLAAQAFWGFGCFSSNSGQQARLVSANPALASIGVALNTSSLYAGQAIGSWVGAAALAPHVAPETGLPTLQSLQWLPWLSCAGLLAACGMSLIAAKRGGSNPR